MNNGMNEGGAGRRVASPVVPGTIMLLSAVLSAFGTAKGNVLMGVLLMMASAAMLALLICMRASLICCILCPVAVVTGSVIITVMGGGLDSVIVFCAFVAVGGVLALCTVKKSDRTGTVIAMSASFALMLLIALIAEYFMSGGVFSAEGVKAFAEGKINVIRTAISDMVNAYAETLKGMGQTVDKSDVKELAKTLADSFIMLMPGLMIAFLQIFCYFVTCIFTFSARKARCEVIIPSPRWELYPTMVTVIIYAVSIVLFGITYIFASASSSGSVVNIVAYNLVLITSPVFAATGVGMLAEKKSPMVYGRRGMFIFMFVILLVFAPQITYTMVSIFGAVAVFIKRRAESLPKNDDDNGMM